MSNPTVTTVIHDTGSEVPLKVVDSRTLAERFSVNAASKLKLASTYVGPVVGIALGAVFSVWKAMNPDQQTGLIGALGIGQVWTGIAVAAITHLGAVFKPAPAGFASPQMLEMLQEIARLKFNALLLKAGMPEVASMQSRLTAEPAVRLIGSRTAAAVALESAATAIETPAVLPTPLPVVSVAPAPVAMPAVPPTAPASVPAAPIEERAVQQQPTPVVTTTKPVTAVAAAVSPVAQVNAQLQAVVEPNDVLSILQKLEPGKSAEQLQQELRDYVAAMK